MSRIAAGSAIVLAFLAGCQDGGGGVDTLQAAMVAAEVREGCVAECLDLFQDLADRLAPLAYVTGSGDLAAAAAAAGCGYAPEGPGHRLFCGGVQVRGGLVDLDLRLVYESLGVEVPDPGLADGLVVDVLAVGPFATTTGRLEFARDPVAGLVVKGTLAATRADGRTVTAGVGRVEGQLVADLPGLATGLVFTAGSVDVDVRAGDAPLASGTAALVGRVAVVALEVRGVHSQGEIALD